MAGLAQIVVIGGPEPAEPVGRDPELGGAPPAGTRAAAGASRRSSTRASPRPSPTTSATIVYTSGTTGPPKGVVQTHGNHMAALGASGQTMAVDRGRRAPAVPAARALVRAAGVVHRRLPRPHHRVRREHRQAAREPARGAAALHLQRAARVREGLRRRHRARRGRPRRSSGRSSTGRSAWAGEVSKLKQAGQPVPGLLALKYRIADKLVFSKMQAALGGRLRFAVSGGAPLSPEIAEFFHAAGILILEGYGLTETCPVLTFNRPTHFKFGSVGQPLPGLEVKIAPDGEILGRGAQHREGLLQEARRHRRGVPVRRLVRHRRHRPDRRRRVPVHHRPEEGPDHHRGRHQHRAPEHREPAQGRSVHQPGDGPRRQAARIRWR